MYSTTRSGSLEDGFKFLQLVIERVSYGLSPDGFNFSQLCQQQILQAASEGNGSGVSRYSQEHTTQDPGSSPFRPAALEPKIKGNTGSSPTIRYKSTRLKIAALPGSDHLFVG